jgi:hypothetical protein
VESLDKSLAKRLSPETPKAGRSLIDPVTVEAMNTAYAATLRYYTAILGGRGRDPKVQQQISRLWQKAGARIMRQEPALASRLKASNSFWSREVTWNKETIHKVWAHLNSIRSSINMLTPVVNAAHRWGTFSSS